MSEALQRDAFAVRALDPHLVRVRLRGAGRGTFTQASVEALNAALGLATERSWIGVLLELEEGLRMDEEAERNLFSCPELVAAAVVAPEPARFAATLDLVARSAEHRRCPVKVFANEADACAWLSKILQIHFSLQMRIAVLAAQPPTAEPARC